MKTVTRRLLPGGAYLRVRARFRNLRDLLKLARAGLYDARQFAGGSGLLRMAKRDALQAHILKSFHRIEKGLALPAPRPGFGSDAVQHLLDDLHVYLKHGGPDWVAQASLDTLEAYLHFNGQAGHRMPAVQSAVQRLRLQCPAAPASLPTGGTKEVKRAELQRVTSMSFDAFARARHSVRQFAPQPVDAQLIERAVATARYAPSVCNRSGAVVYDVADPQWAAALLAHQNGNRGFGDTASRWLVVTVRQAVFHTVGERYQAWIDGGLFAMALVYALHGLGLGTCCLNWSVEPDADRAFKRDAGIAQDEAVIMLIAVGHLADTFVVAQSARRPLEDVLRHLHGPGSASNPNTQAP